MTMSIIQNIFPFDKHKWFLFASQWDWPFLHLDIFFSFGQFLWIIYSHCHISYSHFSSGMLIWFFKKEIVKILNVFPDINFLFLQFFHSPFNSVILISEIQHFYLIKPPAFLVILKKISNSPKPKWVIQEMISWSWLVTHESLKSSQCKPAEVLSVGGQKGGTCSGHTTGWTKNQETRMLGLGLRHSCCVLRQNPASLSSMHLPCNIKGHYSFRRPVLRFVLIWHVALDADG